jgi:penicillin G amidase
LVQRFERKIAVARTWLRYAKRGVFLLLALIAILALMSYLVLRRSLPTLDGALKVAVQSSVSIERDALGSATISGKSRGDVYFAQGFVHAQERYFEMDLSRRSASGELAELFGKVALERDKSIRVHRMRALAQRALQDLSGADRALLDRYVAGVNAGLAGLASKPWAYLLVGTTPRAWLPEDSLLIGAAMIFNLQDHTNAMELMADTAKSSLSPAAYRYLFFRTSQEFDAPLEQDLPDDAHADPEMPTAEQLNLRALPDAQFDLPATGGSENVRGSNNWAVSSAHTMPVNGKNPAMLANDMHLGLGVPSIWFRQQLNYPDPSQPGQPSQPGAPEKMLQVTGVGLPGVPGTVVGSNGLVAWGITNSYGDWLDFVRLLPVLNQPYQFQMQSQHDQPPMADAGAPPAALAVGHIQHVRELIKVKNAPDVELDVRETMFGPIVAKDHNGLPLALAWAAQRAGGINMNVSNFELAGSVTALLDAAQKSGMPHSNIVAADAAGNVAWGLGGPVPLRVQGHAENGIVDSNQLTGDLWNGFASSNPRVLNPADGRVYTANARVVAGSDLQLIGDGGYALGARAKQIHWRLQAQEHFTEADFLRMQLDTAVPTLERWWQRLSALVDGKPEFAEAAEFIAQWNRSADADSVGYRIVRNWRIEILKREMSGLSAPMRSIDPKFNIGTPSHSEAIVWPILAARAPHLLPKPYASWDALESDSLRFVLAQMRADGPLARRTWGEQNRTAITHVLAKAAPQLDWVLGMPRDPQNGDGGHVVRASGPAFGASERMVVRPGLEAQGIFHMPGGQSDHPLSPFYGAGHADWLEGKATPFLPGASRHRLELLPQGG